MLYTNTWRALRAPIGAIGIGQKFPGLLTGTSNVHGYEYYPWPRVSGYEYGYYPVPKNLSGYGYYPLVYARGY
eukprot:1181923-Prorocentrum_minimum.AAC.4